MDERLIEIVNDFNEDAEHYNNAEDKEWFYNEVKKAIISKTMDYQDDNSDKAQIANDLVRLYNSYFFIRSSFAKEKTFCLEELENLPPAFLIDVKPERFDVDEEMLKNIDVSQGLTPEEANELLKWTANNTRDNLNIDSATCITYRDVYDNNSLGGVCGLSQFLSLYPLQKMGLPVTVNNMSELGIPSHAFGTVTLPIRENGVITNKRYLIDLTYRQFFEIYTNVIGRYVGNMTHPAPGFFVCLDQNNIDFSKKLMKDGFIEATEENLNYYFKPFMMSSLELDRTNTIDDVMANIDFIDVLENRQIELDGDLEYLMECGMNFDIPDSSKTL